MTNEIVNGGAHSAKTRAMEFHRQKVRYLIVHRLSCDAKENPDRKGFSHDRGSDATATAFNIATRQTGFVDSGMLKAVQLIFNYCNRCKMSLLWMICTIWTAVGLDILHKSFYLCSVFLACPPSSSSGRSFDTLRTNGSMVR